MSVVWRFNNGMDTLPALSLAVGVVVADIIKNYGIDVDLKWPNDVLVKGKKIAGVLIESRIKPNGSIDAVIGVGVNVAMGVKDSVMIDQPWSDLDTEKTIKEELDRSQIAGKLLSAIMSLCSNYEQKGFDEYRPRWLEYDICSGREVQILENDMTYYGDCVGIDEAGALKVMVDGVEKLSDSGRLKKSLNSFSRYQRDMIGGDIIFRWIPAKKRSYHVTVKGPLMDMAGNEVIGHFLETQRVRVSRGRPTKLEYDFRPKETALEIQVMNGEKPVTGARIALRGQNSLIRYARNGSTIIPIGQGTHRLLVASADCVAEYTLHIETLGRSIQLLAQLADENVLVFKDCAAATEPFLAGDYLSAAEALDAAGQQHEAHLMRATFHQQVGASDAAAQELEAAGKFEEAAELRAVGDDAAGSAALFEKAGDSGRAADAYRAAGEIADAARCYEAAYDYQNALECYREIGEDSKALEILEKTGEFFEAGCLARELGDHDRAIGNLQQVERRDANYGNACEKIADTLETRGDFDAAVDKIEEAIQEAGDNASAALHERHAQLLSMAGRPERAIDAYQTVRRIDPRRRDVSERIAELQQQAVPRPNEGNVESRYEILGEVGRGAMGIVFKARDKNLGRVVALKRLPDSLKNHPTAVALFKREAQAAAALNHRNIVTLFDAGEENGSYFITMELLEGFPLNQLLSKRGRLSVPDTARIGIQVAAGLQYACEQRIVHRDIKSGNLFFTTDRTVKIMDFGLAKTIEEVRKSSTMIGGTPNFMAPEQAAGGEVDHRADLYAFGVTLYQLVTGTVPFEDGDLAYHHRHTAPPDPCTRVDSIPASLSRLILQMLAKSPDERPVDPAEVGRKLQAILDGCKAASTK